MVRLGVAAILRTGTTETLTVVVLVSWPFCAPTVTVKVCSPDTVALKVAVTAVVEVAFSVVPAGAAQL